MSNLTPEARARIAEFMEKMKMPAPGMPGSNYATIEEFTKVYVYMERSMMYLMTFLIHRKLLTPKEAIQIFISAMNDAGESDEQIKSSAEELKKIFGYENKTI